MRYSLVKVLPTVSPFRPSFSPHPQHASLDHRFLSPLFSKCYELLFPQLFCFHNHLRCPLVFSSRCIFPLFTRRTRPRVITFRMNTCKNVTKQTTLSSFGMNTYARTGRGVLCEPPRTLRLSVIICRSLLALCFHHLAASLFTLCVVFRTRILCFQSFAASFTKSPGWGYPPNSPLVTRHSLLPMIELFQHGSLRLVRSCRRSLLPLLYGLARRIFR